MILLIVWEHQGVGKTMSVVRILQLNLSASHVASELSDIAPTSFSARVRPTSLLSASFTKYEHGLDNKIVISSISQNLQHYRDQQKGCLLSFSQAEPGRELTQPSPRLLTESSNAHHFVKFIRKFLTSALNICLL